MPLARNTPSLRCQTFALTRGTRYLLSLGDTPLTFAEALQRLVHDAGFRADLTALLAASEYTAYRWETPPVTRARSTRPFEFVLMNSPRLAPEPEPDAFSAYFDQQPASVDVLAIPNLGRTAMMIVPRQLSEPQTCAHLARFVRGAPEAQIHHLWQCVAETVLSKLSDRPLWLSTAGGGVSWLHVRVEGIPKYYTYRPYADGA